MLRRALMIAVLVTLGGAAAAQSTSLAQCRGIVDNLARLTCYDRLADQQRGVAGSNAAGAAIAPVAPLAVPPSTGSGGCGSRGGPGYRLANGRCASWEDARRGRR